MTSSLPCFRRDLAVSQQSSADGAMFVIKEPDRRQFFRIGEVEYFIAAQLDGETPLTVVQHRAEEKFQAALPQEILAGFVRRLERAGLLESGRRSAERRRQRRVEGSLLYLRVRVCDPDRLLGWMARHLNFFYTPAFMVLSALTILGAVAVAMTNWEEAAQTLPRLYQLSAIPVISLVIFLVIAAHEFAHGLTCKRLGGEVREMGFMLVYFQPALYCNVSDAWLFPEKSKRLWVGFAGPYFELFLWALCTIAWRLTDVETTINYLAFIVMTSSGIKTLFNFNPLIKLDGYYLLSDWLEIPNLRKRAFARAGAAIKRVFGVRDPDWDKVPPREARICLVYGLIAATCSFVFLAFAMSKFGTYLVEQRQPLALVMVTGLLGIKVKSRFRRLFGKKGGVDPDDPDSIDADDEPEPAKRVQAVEANAIAPAAEAVPPTPSSPASQVSQATKTDEPAKPEDSAPREKRRKPSKFWRKLRRGALAIGATAALITVMYYVHAELRIGGAFDVLPIQNADVRAGIEGLIEEIPVDEGQMVKKGDLIARLADRDVRVEQQKIAAQIDEARARLKLLEAGSRKEEIELAEAIVARAEEQIKFTVSRLSRDKLMFEQKLISLNDYEESQRQLAALESDRGEAKTKLNLLLAGSRPEEIEALRATIVSLETQHSYLGEQLKMMRVLSPATGVVATPTRQLHEMRYQLVKKGDLIAKVFELDIVTAEIVISERDIADIQVGQDVVLKVRAYPEMVFRGKVKAIATAAQILASSSSTPSPTGATPGFTRNSVAPKAILVTTEIENPSHLLKPEMTGQAKILCGERRLLELATRRAARSIKVQFWSWW
jgi:putative peptide zinc metalloprotease protein